VVRFATELGYPGYPALQRAMQEMIRSRLTAVQRMEVAENRIGQDKLPEAVLTADIENIRATMESLSPRAFEAAVDAIVSSRRIYIAAARSSAPLASFLGYYFTLIFGQVTVVNAVSESEFFEKMFRIDASDVVIGLSFPRYSTSMAKAMHFAQSKGATVISVTDSENSPIARHATHLLLAQSNMVSVADSLVAPMSLINAMIVAVVERKKNDVVDALERLEAVWDEYGIYEKVVD
jgi:DNA-binding MurR/RpiR family transcriptional regulator